MTVDINSITYLLFGFSLVGIFAGIIIYYFSRRRKNKVEEPKYRMLDED